MTAVSLRLQQSADFERVLARPSTTRSAHFALHYVPACPLPARKPATKMKPGLKASAGAGLATTVPSFDTELSTGVMVNSPQLVDSLVASLPAHHWLGCVVPKRHAKRAVTRNLLKRQMRSVFDASTARLPCGQWLVRLRSPFASAQFVSARSPALKLAARTELLALLAKAADLAAA